eukprot:8186312-Alexandrium_andersonii.AAC.1
MSGRKRFKKTEPVTGVRAQDGRWVSAPPEVDEVLWDSRQAIWTSQPPWPEGANALLQRYITDRRHL